MWVTIWMANLCFIACTIFAYAKAGDVSATSKLGVVSHRMLCVVLRHAGLHTKLLVRRANAWQVAMVHRGLHGCCIDHRLVKTAYSWIVGHWHPAALVTSPSPVLYLADKPDCRGGNMTLLKSHVCWQRNSLCCLSSLMHVFCINLLSALLLLIGFP